MKKAAVISLISIILLAVLFVVSVPIVNDLTAADLEKKITSIPVPDKSELVESISKAGRLSGNGNGMQYFAAILLKSELSLEEIKAHYAEYGDNKLTYNAFDRNDEAWKTGINFSFSSEIDPNENYYIIFTWGDGIEPFKSLDLRGH